MHLRLEVAGALPMQLHCCMELKCLVSDVNAARQRSAPTDTVALRRSGSSVQAARMEALAGAPHSMSRWAWVRSRPVEPACSKLRRAANADTERTHRIYE